MSAPITAVAPPPAVDALWDEFLERWPLASLSTMSLTQYTQAGSKDCFTYWLESRTEDLGSIWGGSAFKFGVYSRRDQTEKTANSSARAFSTTHGWLTKYGASADEAFERVRGILTSVALAARAGDLDAVERADFGATIKWKIAFLYQDRQHPCVLPIFLPAALRALPGKDPKSSSAALQRALMAAKPVDESLLAYGQRLWGMARQVLHARLSNDDVLAYLQAYPGLAPTKPATDKHAGFRCADGRELCLLRSRKTPVIYVQPGDWQDAVSIGATHLRHFAPDDARSHGFTANAPSLAIPNEAVAVTIGTWDLLMELLEAYTGTTAPPARTADGKVMQTVTSADGNSRLGAGREAPLNQIFHGPPGTGKTYFTIEAALNVLDAPFLARHLLDRAALKARFDALVQERRISLVTFHQSFSYEDFVEGLRATASEDTGQIRYEVVDGVFKSLCEAAAVKVIRPQEQAVPAAPIDVRGRRIWKMSLGNTLGSDAAIYDECIDNGYVLLGYGGAVDFTGCTSRGDVFKRCTDNGLQVGPQNDYTVTSVAGFVTRIKPGDLLVISDGNLKFRAIGEVSGEYQFQSHNDYPASYAQMRRVKWLRVYEPSLPHGELMNNQFSQMTLYELSPKSIDLDKLQRLLDSQPPAGSAAGEPMLGGAVSADADSTGATTSDARVLIIDEINRGNISRIFGELITLIEPSKRAGATEALEVVLPYSKKPFSVPRNVYLIGTMNTADRSLTGMDVALRRRFVFTAMPPRPECLRGVEIDGICIDPLLSVINQRIEALLDRDHCLGHAYFMPLRQTPRLEKLEEIFRHQVLPLLQEYFFDDWQRIQWVLNDHRKSAQFQFVSARNVNVGDLFGANVNVSSGAQVWSVNDEAFSCAESYLGVIDHRQAQDDE